MHENTAILRAWYDALRSAWGPQHWWPAESATEVIIGAILTQNTAWRNVERAIGRLREADCLNWAALHALSLDEIGALIRPAGTFRVKAKRLAAFVEVLCGQFSGSLDAMLSGGLDEVRQRLLAIHGIGRETADCILLYAGHRPSFVVDAHTRRILRRHFLSHPSESYDIVRSLFMEALPDDAQLFNEYHALLVRLAKEHCRARADCRGCPLAAWPHNERL